MLPPGVPTTHGTALPGSGGASLFVVMNCVESKVYYLIIIYLEKTTSFCDHIYVVWLGAYFLCVS